MALITLVRHGQASWGQADYDVLSVHGHRQARVLGASWRTAGIAPSGLFTGTMRRHVDTAHGIAAGLASGPQPEVLAGWEEFDHVDVLAESLAEDGSLPPADEATMEEMFATGLRRWIAADGTRTYRETYVQFRARARGAFAELCGGLGTDDKAVVVTSGGVIAGIVCDLLDVAPERWPELAGPVVNTSTHKILVRRGHPTLVSFNEHGHLAIEDITYA